MTDRFKSIIAVAAAIVGILSVVVKDIADNRSEQITRLEIHLSSLRFHKDMVTEKDPVIKALTKVRAMLNVLNDAEKNLDRAWLAGAGSSIAFVTALAGAGTFGTAFLIAGAISFLGMAGYFLLIAIGGI